MTSTRDIAMQCLPYLVLGLGLDGSLPQHPGLAATELLVGGSGQLRAYGHLAPQAEQLPIAGSLDACLGRAEQARLAGKRVTVLASGDPLYFGIGATLAKRFGPAAVTVVPAVSSLQAAAARLGLPWDGICSVSLHGRSDFLPLAHALFARSTVCVLTDPDHDPAAIARFLLERGCGHYRLEVFEALGSDRQRHASLGAEEAATHRFASPNTVFLLPDPQLLCPPLPYLGMPDTAFARSRDCVTKRPVRAAVLAALRILPDSTVWDIGSGSGSIAMEAAVLAYHGRVLAVESDPARTDNIRANRSAFGVAHLDVVHGAAPDCLDLIPGNPDAIVLGGGLGTDDESARKVLNTCFERLRPGGRLVAPCVLLESAERFRAFARFRKLDCATLTLSCAENAPLGHGSWLKPLSPVSLLSLEKESSHE